MSIFSFLLKENLFLYFYTGVEYAFDFSKYWRDCFNLAMNFSQLHRFPKKLFYVKRFQGREQKSNFYFFILLWKKMSTNVAAYHNIYYFTVSVGQESGDSLTESIASGPVYRLSSLDQDWGLF